MAHEIQLTQTVKKGGCAAKVAASELRAILNKVKFPPNDSSVLVDGGLFDDAAIYKVSEDLALVQTLDFFTPIVDSPKSFGAVAAANALSDVYAMGGTPKTAMAILAFPLAVFEHSTVVDILQGASDKMAEAGVSFVGGHSIDDDTLKFGLSVTGFVDPKKVWSNSRAQQGDDLILTKALGTGTCMAALKRQAHSEIELGEAMESMMTLNQILDLLDGDEADAIHAATDITGFGLLGHSQQMAKASEKKLVFEFEKLPLFELTMPCLEKGFLTKAHGSNAQYTKEFCRTDQLGPMQKLALTDPQTSGGLLLSVDPKMSAKILNKLRSRFARADRVGEVQAASDCLVEVKP